MNDAMTLTAGATTIRSKGREYRVHPLDGEDFGRMQAWVDGQFPDPLDVAHEQLAKQRFTAAQERHLMNFAMELRTSQRRLLGTPEADSVARSAEGMTELLYLSISKGDPAFTRDDARRLFRELDAARLAAAYIATNADMVCVCPKDQAQALLDADPSLAAVGRATA